MVKTEQLKFQYYSQYLNFTKSGCLTLFSSKLKNGPLELEANINKCFDISHPDFCDHPRNKLTGNHYLIKFLISSVQILLFISSRH